jgi:hypothetical protein
MIDKYYGMIPKSELIESIEKEKELLIKKEI